MAKESEYLYGRKPLLEVLRHKPERVEHIYLLPGQSISGQLSSELEKHSSIISSIEKDEMDKLARGGVHQGVLAELREQEAPSLKALICRAKEKNSLIVVLDQVTDPQNLGGILRAAEASGVAGVVLTRERSAPVTAVARKSSSGASELVPVCEVKNMARALEELKKSGFWVVGAVLGEGAQNFYQCELPTPTALVLGSEETGLRRLTKEKCDILVEIPMQGLVQSLSVNQAGAIMMFEVMRRKLEANRGEE